MIACPNCGTESRGQYICVGCGEPLAGYEHWDLAEDGLRADQADTLPKGIPPVRAPLHAQPFAPAAQVAVPTKKRSNWAPVLVVVGMLLIVAAAGVGWWVGAGNDSDPPVARVAPADGDTAGESGASKSNKAQASAPATTEEGAPVAEESPAAAALPIRCWHGGSAQDREDCGLPADAAFGDTPLAGINWIFQDRGKRLEAAGARCTDDGQLRERILHRTCSVQVAGSDVCLNYSQWKTSQAGESSYNRIGGRETFVFRKETLVVWGPEAISVRWDCGARSDWSFKTATMVAGHIWGATAYSDDPDAAATALEEFAEFREVRDWWGVEK